jgi:RNA-directed DNA polymerase
MGLFDWLRQIVGGGMVSGPAPVVRFRLPGVCPYCGVPLRTAGAKQCFVCGADWHDPRRVVRRFVSPADAAAERQRRVVAGEGVLAGGPAARTPGIGTAVSGALASPGRQWTQRTSSNLTGLDASKFAPITRGEILAIGGAAGSALRSGGWFGRRDLIPPDSDTRTLLIDRAMVTQGLLSPDELVHIHKIGAEMDRIRPDIAHASLIADQAVARSQAEREALKQQKKQEAAERKRLHAEGVARRKQTDIVFLGRGVSRGLADRRANVEKLEQLGLPMLATPADVAAAMGVSIPRLRWLAFHNEAALRTHYVRFTVPKKSGGTRELASPHRDLRRCQEWILHNVLDKLAVHEAAHGFARGRSTVTNAAGHAGREVIVNTDLKDFFPSITFPRVMGMFCGMGYSPAVATILALLCTECPRRTVQYAGTTYHVATGPRALPQGACTSPALSNRAARKLDARLAGLAAKLGWTYTRYADDATFSAGGETAESVGYLLARIRHISQDEGFAVNEKKTRVLRRNTAQLVTGIVVNQHPAAPRKLVRRLRAILHRAKTEGLAAQNRCGHPRFEAWLGGMVAYVSMVNPDQGRPLQRKLAALSERDHKGSG